MGAVVGVAVVDEGAARLADAIEPAGGIAAELGVRRGWADRPIQVGAATGRNIESSVHRKGAPEC